eukprot:4069758-Amphidinium_carterae.1
MSSGRKLMLVTFSKNSGHSLKATNVNIHAASLEIVWKLKHRQLRADLRAVRKLTQMAISKSRLSDMFYGTFRLPEEDQRKLPSNAAQKLL